MIICICNNIDEDKFRDDPRAREIAGSRCGKCTSYIKELQTSLQIKELEEHKNRALYNELI